MKRPITEWETMFLNHIPDKLCASRIYEELSKLNIKKKNLIT